MEFCNYICSPIPEKGKVQKVKGEMNADGSYTMHLEHFSTYALVSEEEAETLIANSVPSEEELALEEAAKNEKIKAGIKATTIKASSKLVKAKSGKKGIKITWTKSKGYKVDYYQILRSTKKNSGYKKVFQTVDGNKTSYTNTKNIKKGKTYYYKVRGVRVVDGVKVYTKWSTNAHRIVK